jgi:hypothetical protein
MISFKGLKEGGIISKKAIGVDGMTKAARTKEKRQLPRSREQTMMMNHRPIATPSMTTTVPMYPTG